MITKGQARRIASEWQNFGNACSALQHKGVIEDGLPDEIKANLRTGEGRKSQTARELRGLLVFARHHGTGKVTGWGAWDDTPVEVEDV